LYESPSSQATATTVGTCQVLPRPDEGLTVLASFDLDTPGLNLGDVLRSQGRLLRRLFHFPFVADGVGMRLHRLGNVNECFKLGHVRPPRKPRCDLLGTSAATPPARAT